MASKKAPKTSAKQPDGKAVQASRKLKKAVYSSFKLQKRIKTQSQVPGVFRLFADALKVLAKNWKVFAGIAGWYGVLNILLAQGLSSLQGFDSGQSSQGSSALSTFSAGLALLTSSDNLASSDPSASVYRGLLIILVSLATIWTLRQIYANKAVRIRDGFYRGMYPLVQFVIVLVVVGLQLIPFAVGAFLYNAVATAGIAATSVELVAWAVIFLVLALASLYMITSSLFALYIVCLPDMTPLQALRSARQLVAGRRWACLRKIVFLPVALLVVAMVLILPILFVIPVAAVWLYFAFSLAGLVVAHSYMYRLYRALL